MSIRTKFLIILLVLTSIFMGYVHLIWFPKLQEQFFELTEVEYKAHIHTAAEGLVPLLLENQLANVYETLDAIKTDNPEWLSVTLHLENGQRLYPLVAPPEIPLQRATLEITDTVGFIDPPLAYITIVIDLSNYIEVVNRLEYSLGIALSIMMLAFVISIAFQAEFMIRRPIALLFEASKELAAGKYQAPIPIHRKDEVGDLARGFSEMRQLLMMQHGDIKKEVEYQRRKADELAVKKAEADYIATHDALTGLVNRFEFETRLNIALYEATTYGEYQALLYIDLDWFKAINDTCGHHAGDELLKEIVVLMSSLIRDQDTLARIGGDEFGLLLHSCQPTDAINIANKICSEIAQYKFYWEGKFYSVGASIGVTPYMREYENITTWINAADQACYAAKKSGKGIAQLTLTEVPQTMSESV